MANEQLVHRIKFGGAVTAVRLSRSTARSARLLQIDGAAVSPRAAAGGGSAASGRSGRARRAAPAQARRLIPQFHHATDARLETAASRGRFSLRPASDSRHQADCGAAVSRFRNNTGNPPALTSELTANLPEITSPGISQGCASAVRYTRIEAKCGRRIGIPCFQRLQLGWCTYPYTGTLTGIL